MFKKSGIRFASTVLALMGLGVGVGLAPAQADSPRSPYTVARVGTSSTYTATPSSGSTLTGTLKSVVETAAALLTDEGGGTIRFGSGTFDLGSSYWKLSNVVGVTFEGAGMGTTLIANDSSVASDTEPFNMTASDRITIRDLTVSAKGSVRLSSDAIDFDGGDNVVIERVEVTASRGRGIVFDGKGLGTLSHADDNIVRNCRISNLPSDGIELLASNRNLIEGCQVSGVAGHGIQITQSSASAEQAHKPSNDNVLRNNTVDQSGIDGVNVNSGNGNQIVGNRVTNSSDNVSSRDGIRIGSTDSKPCDRNAVRTNVATDTQSVKTQTYGLNISSAVCMGTIVGPDNDFTGNRVGAVRNSGTGTVFEGSTTPPSSKSLAVPISAGADDAEERDDGTVARSSRTLELVTDVAPQVVGLRFANVMVPRGATITQAYVQFTVRRASSGTAAIDVRLQLSGNAAPIAGTARNLSSRLSAATGAVRWSPAPWSTVGAAGTAQRTPGLSANLQQVVARSDWSSGNAVMVLLTGSGQRKAHAYDGSPATAAVLHVTYTTS